MSLYQLCKSLFRTSIYKGSNTRGHFAGRRRRNKLTLETLEARHLLAAYTFKGGATGVWSSPGSWDTAGPPVYPDTAIFSATPVTFLTAKLTEDAKGPNRVGTIQATDG